MEKLSSTKPVPGAKRVGAHCSRGLNHHTSSCASLLSRVWLWDPMACSPPGSSVHGILRQEHWSGLPCPPPADLPDPGIEPISPVSPASQAGSLPTESSGKPPTSSNSTFKTLLKPSFPLLFGFLFVLLFLKDEDSCTCVHVHSL